MQCCGVHAQFQSTTPSWIGPQPRVNQPAVTKKGLCRREQCYGIRMSQFELRALKTLLENTLSETQFQVFFSLRAGWSVRWWNSFKNQLRCSKTIKKSTILTQPTFNYAYISCFSQEQWHSTITATSRFTIWFRNHISSVWLFLTWHLCVCVH